MTRQSFSNSRRSVCVGNLTVGQRMVTNDGIACQADVGLRSSCLLVLPSVPNEEAVQFNAIAIEVIDVMVTPESFDARSGTGAGHRSAFRRIEETGLTQETVHARERSRRGIEGGGKCSPLFSVQTEELPVC
jgi:hypothetical protein